MITLQDLFLYLNQFLSSEEFKDYCPNGLQVEGKSKIHKICFAVSASLAVIEECVRRKADALIVHHGIFWEKQSQCILGTKRKKLQQLLSHEVSLLAYHLPLDAHITVGNNWKAALDLGWENLVPFGYFDKRQIGVKGTFPSMSTEEFKHQLESYYGHVAHVALGGKKQVASCALISGGAHRSIEEAARAGVDCFITGSFDEPIWDIAHEEKINFFSLGHYATERIGILALLSHIEKQFQIRCEFIDFPNPF